MSTMAQVNTSKRQAILDAYSSYSNTFGSSRIAAASEGAHAAMDALDFPTSKTEYWKYTRVNKLVKSNFSFQKYDEKIDLTPYIIPGFDCHTMVFVNGFFREDLSCKTEEAGLTVVPMSAIENEIGLDDNYGNLVGESDQIFAALNTRYPSDGACIMAQKNKVDAKPIHAIFITTGEEVIAQPRNLFIAEEGASLSVVISEFSMNSNQSFNNGITEIVVARNASLSVDLIQNQTGDNYLLNQVDVNQAKDSRFTINTLTVAGKWVRNNLNIRVAGENCETHLNGTYAPKGKSHVDNHTVVDHLVPHCESHELYKGILYDQGTAVFNGKVFVRQDAQLTNAFQQNANILISDDANVYSKPELEIYADDVKCSHGSTIGQFDEDALFYLMARGISKENAKRLLVDAFVGDVIDKIADLKVREYVTGLF